MKKIFSLACAASVMCLMAACGGNNAANADSDTVVVEDTVVAEVLPDSDTVVAEVETVTVEEPAAPEAKKPATKPATVKGNDSKKEEPKPVEKTEEQKKEEVIKDAAAKAAELGNKASQSISKEAQDFRNKKR